MEQVTHPKFPDAVVTVPKESVEDWTAQGWIANPTVQIVAPTEKPAKVKE